MQEHKRFSKMLIHTIHCIVAHRCHGEPKAVRKNELQIVKQRNFAHVNRLDVAFLRIKTAQLSFLNVIC